MSENGLINLCVLTGDQGDMAVNIAHALVDQLDEKVQLLFVNNGSFQEPEQHQSLLNISEACPYIHYHRHEFNQGFNHNYLACFQMVKSPYIMMLSDEDFVSLSMVREVLPLLLQYPSVGIMRGSRAIAAAGTTSNAFDFPDASFMAGEEAMISFFMENDNFSGTIYNRSLLAEKGIIDMLARRIDDFGLTSYPHIYLDLLACAVTDVVTTSKIAVHGDGVQASISEVPLGYVQPYTFGSRIDQFIILRDCLIDSLGLVGEKFDVALFVALYLKLCDKYLHLVSNINNDIYRNHQLHPDLLHQAMCLVCSSAISDYSDLTDYQSVIQTELDQLNIKYDTFTKPLTVVR